VSQFRLPKLMHRLDQNRDGDWNVACGRAGYATLPTWTPHQPLVMCAECRAIPVLALCGPVDIDANGKPVEPVDTSPLQLGSDPWELGA